VRNVAAGCVVAGKPARVVEKDIRTGKYRMRLDAAAPEGLERGPATRDMVDDAARDKIGVLS
jgi:hypothetical protein